MAPSHESLVAHRDDRRVRELYRYFQPANPAAVLYKQHVSAAEESPVFESPDPIIPTAESTRNTLAVSLMPPQEDLASPNTMLTSFTQLAAHKLNVERAVITVLGRDSEYILAEAARDEQTSTQRLWAGYATDERFRPKLNLNTVALPASTKKEYQFQVINDLSTDPRFADLPFVTQPPHFRFYAGTPLTTENGINIGVLFVIDPKPRDGLEPREKEALGSLASISMDFLRVSRQASEGRRAARMSRGLSCFVEGSSSFVDGFGSLDSGSHRSGYGSGSNHGSARSSGSARSGSARSSPSLSAAESPNPPSRRSRGSRGSRGSSIDVRPSRSPGPSSSEGQAETGTSSDVTTPLPDWLLSGTKSSKARLADEMHNNHWTFRRAANLIRESLDLTGESGVIFLENSNTPLDTDNSWMDYFEDSDAPAPAPVLGVSTNDEPFAPEPGSTASCAAANCDRRFLQNVLRRYPKGKVWTFHRDRSLFPSSDDDERSPNSPVSAVKTPDSLPATTKKWRASEATQLTKYFPNASQVLFVPLWNAATSQWYAGCFCWTCTETRIFSPVVELASVMGFGYSIMAELSRLESIIADRQKGDFIGSISHELRSPLHGILAAAEFMDGTYMNDFQKSLLETINACGRTLLDTMNQVLDFSKIVSLEKSWRQVKKARRDSKEDVVDNIKGVDSMAALLDSHVCEDICTLVEEVVEGVCLGHSYGRSAGTGSTGPSRASSMPSGTGSSSLSTPDSETTGEIRPDVEVIVDVDEGDWVFKTQPGALRRIIMNIFGNAMKYTDTGHILVGLKALKDDKSLVRSKLEKDADEYVVLTVSDTGKGISEEFLRARLFTPFAQEDTLAVGTGLGLSIVRSIVKSLGGHIGIRSRPGEGTSVKVTLPLTRPGPDDASSPPLRPHHSVPGQDLRSIRDQYANKTVAILGYDPASPSKTNITSVLADYATKWCGLDIVPWPAPDSVDLLLALDKDVNEELKVRQTIRARAMVVICSNTVDYETYHSAWSNLTNVMEFLYRPCGPYKLARSLLRCFKQSAGIPPSQQAGIQHSRLVDRTRMNPESKIENSLARIAQDKIPKPALGNLRSHTESQVGPPRPDLLSPTIEELPEIQLSEGILGRRPAPAVPTLDGSKGDALSPPQEQEIALSPATAVNVLVVDDNHINLRLLLTYLSRRNVATLDSAENGKMAVEAVEKRPEGYDIIFMDISMPVMNGFEATRSIRSLENERGEQKPATIIALTGLSSARDETEAMTSGVDLFLTKPVSLKEVSRLLDEWKPKEIDS